MKMNHHLPDKSVPIRTLPDLRSEFERLGVSIADWSRTNGFSSALVYQILAGRKRCLRGQSHQIAVRLGLKQGGIGTVADIGATNTGTKLDNQPDHAPETGTQTAPVNGESS